MDDTEQELSIEQFKQEYLMRRVPELSRIVYALEAAVVLHGSPEMRRAFLRTWVTQKVEKPKSQQNPPREEKE